MRVLLAAFLLIMAGIASGPALAQPTGDTNSAAQTKANPPAQTDAAQNRVEAPAAPGGNQSGQGANGSATPNAGGNVVGDSGKALVKLFILAVLLEFALALIFNWRPFVMLFDGRGVKTIVSFGASLIVVYVLKPDAVGELMASYGSDMTGSADDIAKILEAMIIAGGSAGVNNLLVTLGVRSQRSEQVAPRPKENEAWISVALSQKTLTVGPVDVFITEKGKPAALLGCLSATRRRRSFFLRDPARLPPAGGITLTPGKVYTIEARGKNAAGVAVDREWGGVALAAGAAVDIEFEM